MSLMMKVLAEFGLIFERITLYVIRMSEWVRRPVQGDWSLGGCIAKTGLFQQLLL